MTPSDQKTWIQREAEKNGFERVAIAKPGPIGRATYLRQWLESGKAGTMAYLRRYLQQRLDPTILLPGAQSVILFSLSYHQPRPPDPTADDAARGRVAMYAWGDDYHKIMKRKIFRIADALREQWPDQFEAKVCVDTAPLLEREWAAIAGIGWIGKNTLVLNERDGSYFFLGALVTTLALPPDEPAVDHCGTCTACLDACPTNAFPAPYQMDASRCISYLTIEHHGDIDASLKPAMGDWLFGCDICQEVCPHNRNAPHTRELGFAIRPPGPAPRLEGIAGWSKEDYRTQLRASAGKRARLEMWQRNARIAIENKSRSS
ncbi:MAG: tRNA epoxyqueuosine(34) reductase QueG [Phycisphaerae bacterium]